MLVKDMKGVARDMLSLDDRLKESIKAIPKAIKELQTKFQPVTEEVTAGVGDILGNAKLVREKVDIFNERIDDAMKKAKRFNALLTKQNNYEENKLEPEILEMSGAVLSQLNRARELSTNILARQAEEILKVAKEQNLAYTQQASTGELPLGVLVLAQQDASDSGSRSQLPRRSGRRHPVPNGASCSPSSPSGPCSESALPATRANAEFWREFF